MKTKIVDLIDFEKVNTLLEGFNKSTGFVTAILSLDGKVLSKSGWRPICNNFHRVHPETSKKCTISDTVLAGKLKQGEKYHFYKCLNGLVDVAVPVVINGEHIANLFSGQFFFEEPDKTFFQKQANKFGFNEENYLKALVDVPVVSKEKAKQVMGFLLDMTELISNMTFQKMEYLELIDELKESEQRWQFALEGSGDGVWDWDVKSNKVYYSKRWKEMLGYEEHEISDHIEEWETRLHPDDKEQCFLDLNKHFNGETEIYENEHRVLCKDGSYKWILDRGKVVSFTEDHKPLRVIGTHIDLSTRKEEEKELRQSREHLEDLVKERTTALEVSREALLNLVDDLNIESEKSAIANKRLSEINKELETFTYSVSHDLKAPLRGIDGYSQLLLENYYDELNDEARGFLTNIRHSAHQMNTLIEDLLAYSRMERQEYRIEKVHFKTLVDNLLLFYSKTINSHKVSIQLNFTEESKPIGDKEGLNLVMRNLLDNAIKFTSHKKDAKIEIGASETDAHWLIYVKDNGVGFDMKYHDKLFKIFHRLHLAEEYQGTGIGLAMVSKAAQRMNGKIWAESEPGKGSCFYLEIRKPLNK